MISASYNQNRGTTPRSEIFSHKFHQGFPKPIQELFWLPKSGRTTGCHYDPGDPLMDLGSSLAYWVEPEDPPEIQAIRTMPTHLEGALSRKQMIDYYAQLSGRSIEDFSFYYCFGLFRLAVIAQQIYYRYYHGQTKDQRFKDLILYVVILEKVARSIIVPM